MEHEVDLFQGLTLAFLDADVREQEANGCGGTENQPYLGVPPHVLRVNKIGNGIVDDAAEEFQSVAGPLSYFKCEVLLQASIDNVTKTQSIVAKCERWEFRCHEVAEWGPSDTETNGYVREHYHNPDLVGIIDLGWRG
jgi:hypothetical protein